MAIPGLTVESIMVSKVHAITSEMTVRDAISMLLEHKISGAPVIDDGRKVMSIVSEGDLLKLAASVGLEKTIYQCMIKLTKTDKLVTSRKTDSFKDVYVKFLSRSVHRIIVVDDMGRLEGLVSRSNILKIITETKSVPKVA